MRKLRILLADDHAVVREGLKALIYAQKDMEVVAEASDGLVAIELAAAAKPDVAVLDVSMPGLNGLLTTERLRQRFSDLRVLALTVHEDKCYLRKALSAGASGYVLKRAASTELIGAIRSVAAGGTYIDPTIAGKLLGSSDRGDIILQSAEGRLSDREEEVLRLIAVGNSNKEAALQLGISTKTVETYKARCLEKLGLKTRADIVRFAIRQGWLEAE